VAGVERSEPPVGRVSGGSPTNASRRCPSTPATRVWQMANLELLNMGDSAHSCRPHRVFGAYHTPGRGKLQRPLSAPKGRSPHKARNRRCGLAKWCRSPSVEPPASRSGAKTFAVTWFRDSVTNNNSATNNNGLVKGSRILAADRRHFLRTAEPTLSGSGGPARKVGTALNLGRLDCSQRGVRRGHRCRLDLLVWKDSIRRPAVCPSHRGSRPGQPRRTERARAVPALPPK